MLSRDKAFKVLVGLVCDMDLECIDSILDGEVFAVEDRDSLWRIGRMLSDLVGRYDYLTSTEFATAMAGRSTEYSLMKVRIESAPKNRKRHQQRFEEALGNLMSSDDAFRLLTESKHDVLRAIRREVGLLTNPAE